VPDNYLGFLLPGEQCLKLTSMAIDSQTMISDMVYEAHIKCIDLFEKITDKTPDQTLHDLEIDTLETINRQDVERLARRIGAIKDGLLRSGAPPQTTDKSVYTDYILNRFASAIDSSIDEFDTLIAGYNMLNAKRNECGFRGRECERERESSSCEECSEEEEYAHSKRRKRACVVLDSDVESNHPEAFETPNEAQDASSAPSTSTASTAPTSLVQALEDRTIHTLEDVRVLRSPTRGKLLGSRRAVLRSSASAVEEVVKNYPPKTVTNVCWAVSVLSTWVDCLDRGQLVRPTLEANVRLEELDKIVESCAQTSLDLKRDLHLEHAESMAALSITLFELLCTEEADK
jgi:hypothetical protein